MAIVWRQIGFFFFFPILFVLNSASLHHHDREERRMSGLDGLRRTLLLDAARLRAISEKSRRKLNSRSRQIKAPPNRRPRCRDSKKSVVSATLPMYSGADFGVGQYFVHFRAGSPAQKVALIADTGSDLTWMKCKYGCPWGKCRNGTSTRFSADRSVSFKTLACSSSKCRVDLADLFSLSRCPSPSDPCAYDYRYIDGSSSRGIFAHETVALKLTSGRKARLHNVLIGCSGEYSGQSFQAADGVLGLGYSNFSFAASAAARFGGKFAYCLVDHLSPKNKSSYIAFGPHKFTSDKKIRYTDLVLGVIGTSYAVHVKAISIGSELLEIPSETWSLAGVGGVIIDSGSSLTALTRPAYRPVMAALEHSLASFETLDLDLGPLRYCFNSTGFDESAVPRLTIHFAGGTRFSPPVKSYVIDAAPGVKCLGFVEAAWPGVSVIGNILQQNHIWEFDLVNRRLGFATSSCTQVQ